jgi:hypothetical protein
MTNHTLNYTVWGRMVSCAPVGNRRLLKKDLK